MNIEIIYFGFPFWRAEVSRLALHLGNIPFTNTHVTRQQFLEQKQNGLYPFGQLPIMIVDGHVIAQTGAMARFCGKLSNLYPTDPIQAARVDQFLDGANDLTVAMGPSMWTKDPDEKRQKRKEAVDTIIPKWFSNFERLVVGPYCTETFSIADLAMWRLLGWFSEGTLDQVPTDILSAYPKLQHLYQTIGGMPQVQEWMQQYQR